MTERVEIVIPDELRAFAEAQHQAFQAEHAEEAQREAREKARQAAALRKQIMQGLPFAERISAWALAFREDAAGRQLIEVGHDELHYIRRHGVYFFDGKAEGCPWRGLGVGSQGLWWMASGCGASPQYVRSPEELASAIPSAILQVACEWIDSGEVWNCIKRRLGQVSQPRIASRPSYLS